MNAGEKPEAKLHLELARRGYQEATELMKDNDNRKARLKLKRAEADAELAIALAQADDARQEANEQLERVRELREEMRR